MVKIYHFFADLGVTAIIGHHPHVVRGMEIIDSCPVFYSIGNFYFSENGRNKRYRFIGPGVYDL